MATKKVSGKSKKFAKSSNKKKTMKRGRSVGAGGGAAGGGVGKRRSMRGGSNIMSPTAKMLAREAKRRDFAVQEGKPGSGWTNTRNVWTEPMYVKKNHYYPPVSAVSAVKTHKIRRIGKNPGKRDRGYF